MVERLSLRRLDYFVVAAEVGTMSGAAQRMYVSQSAVSLGIAELERKLGVRLMVRSKAKGLALTEAGRQFLPQARALLARAEEVEAGMRHVGQAVAGPLAVGCLTTIAPFLLPRLLAEFQGSYPGVALEFIEGDLNELQELLLDGRCELAALYGAGVKPDIEWQELYQTQPHVLLSLDHPLADMEPIRLADLAAHDMIMIDVPPGTQYLDQILVDAGVTPVVRHRTKSIELTCGLVARGLGYCLLIQHSATLDSGTDVTYEGQHLRLRPLADDVAPLPVVLAWHSSAQLTPRAAAFAQFCRTATRPGAAP